MLDNIRSQSMIEYIPTSKIQRDIENALDVRTLVKEAKTWA